MLYRLLGSIAFQGTITPDQKMERPRLSHMGCVICRIFKLNLLFLRSLVRFWGVDSVHILVWLPERRHGSNGVPGHAFLSWHSSWQTVVNIYYITAAGIPSARSWAASVRANDMVQKGRRYGPSITYKITPAGHSPPVSHSGCRVGPALWPSVL